ncbi:MAG: ABC transporter ATP-binding protein [Eubacterium sp.]|nr:ABC transporter ATP-binding protein [Eubacterium sp.]
MIKLNDIKKTFGMNQVLKGVSFQIDDGSIYGLIGRNGAGKTTLMNIMSGLMKADGGSFTIDKKVGYLPDLPAFYEYLTTDEYLDFLLMNKNPERRDKLLETVGLPKGAKVKTMSRGMRQRLGIAAVLVNNPDVILLDEPTSALDPAGRNDVKDILLRLKNEGRTIILSTHILADMDNICDKAGFLSRGVIAREVDVAKSRQENSAMIVKFASEPDLDKLYQFTQDIIQLDAVTVRLNINGSEKINSQQKVLQGLGNLSQEITSISSAAVSLDSIFQEVCL